MEKLLDEKFAKIFPKKLIFDLFKSESRIQFVKMEAKRLFCHS